LAVAIYYKSTKLGYIPAKENAVVSQLLNFGHTDVFQAIVLAVDPQASAWKQVYVSIRVRDARA